MHLRPVPGENYLATTVRSLLITVGFCLLELGATLTYAQNGSMLSAPVPPKENSTLLVHHFWDGENVGLFASVGGARMLDYVSTRHFRDRGVNEWLLNNRVVDNRPLFVGIELAATAASVGVSYAFHRTGHHKLERWVSIVHLGIATGGSIRNFTLQSSVPSQMTLNH